MATGLLLEFQGIGEKEYERVMEALRLDQNPVPGAILHTAGPIPNGWRRDPSILKTLGTVVSER